MPENRKYRRRSVTLTFTVTDFGPAVSDADLGRNLDLAIHAWTEGRHDLPVELIHDSLEKLVAQAIRTTIAEEIGARCGGRMVTARNGSGSSSCSVASILTERKCRDVSVFAQNARETDVRIKTTDEFEFEPDLWDELVPDEEPS